jgi:hypothetical protein
MFLHIGSGKVVPLKSIIAILDLEKTTIAKDTRDFLKTAEEEGFIEFTSEEDIPKSFVVTETDKKSKIYLSSISPITLQKRAEYLKRKQKTI